LKNIAINLITKLRLENNILNKGKDGPSQFTTSSINPTQQVMPVRGNKPTEESDEEVGFNKLMAMGNKKSFKRANMMGQSS
jgi:hypothetical protein